MFTGETTQQIAHQHIADLHAAAAEARLARIARQAKSSRRNVLAGFRSGRTTITARPVCTDAN